MLLNGSNLPLYRRVELGQNLIHLIVELSCILLFMLVKVVSRSIEGRLATVCREGARVQ